MWNPSKYAYHFDHIVCSWEKFLNLMMRIKEANHTDIKKGMEFSIYTILIVFTNFTVKPSNNSQKVDSPSTFLEAHDMIAMIYKTKGQSQ